ncbi:hypothetical protein GCM10027596_17020 [Nocardioides korecus]
MRRPARSALAGGILAAVALAGCGLGASGRSDPPPGPDATPYTSRTSLVDWPTYQHTADRAGRVAAGPRGALKVGWRADLEGAVYGQPLVLGDTLVVATEENQVYGLDARTGRQRWRTDLGTPQPRAGLPCGNIDPLGVTGTPAYDPATRRLFVAAETEGGAHTLWSLDPTDGRKDWHRSLDTQPDRNRLAEQQRGALLVTQGRVVTVFGGLAGDCDDYVGYAASVPTDGRGATTSYAVPTAREAGMWATPGAVASPDGMGTPAGTVLVASGNGAELKGRWDGSDSVIELDAASMRRRSVFAPSSWKDDNVKDLDLGSSSPVPVPARQRVVIAGKRGTVYLLKTPFGGIGSEVAQLDGCRAFGGSAVVGSSVVMGCHGPDAIRLLRVRRDGLSWAWTAKGLFTAPVVAGRRVYVADRETGDLVVLSLSSGREVSRQHAGRMPNFPSSVVSGDWVFVGSTDGVTAFRGE